MNLASLLRDLLRAVTRPAANGSPAAPGRTRPRPTAPAPAPTASSDGYPGDFTGVPVIEYAPRDGRLADPGEVAWTWVPYEEDHSQGKDRPVLIIGRDGDWLLALPLTSQDHDRDAGQEASQGRFWLDIGTGPWDTSGRSSEVRVNRILRVAPDAVRRVGARLDQPRFEAVARAVLPHYR
ncbi:MAG TPA: type II toxin-antitoxin system PemK/MazF family toxin [Propionicimonas sp.]|nr:type II toxin-antitoxin system PemK/MazF family toxin [Propionicimonas sp.]